MKQIKNKFDGNRRKKKWWIKMIEYKKNKKRK